MPVSRREAELARIEQQAIAADIATAENRQPREQIPLEIREAGSGIRTILDGSWRREQLANFRRFEEASEKVEIIVGRRPKR